MKNNNKKQSIQTFFIILCSAGALLCLILKLPMVKNFLVNFAVNMLTPFVESKVLHRTINPETVAKAWNEFYHRVITLGFLVCFAADIALLFNRYKTKISVRLGIETRGNLLKTDIDIKSLIKPVLIVFAIYVIGYISVIRANFSYIDDLGRSAAGYRRWAHYSRFISNYLSILIHSDAHITDISPLPQIITCFILAVSSVLLVYILCDKKLTLRNLFASIPLGLSPYFLECFSFKFDSPYMALSVLFSIVPFLYLENIISFALVSVVGLTCMLMSYQAASGIYIIIAVFFVFITWSKGNKTAKEILKTVFAAVACYGFALLFYRLFIVTPFYNPNVGYSAYSLKDFIFGFINNTKSYLNFINNDFGIIWKVLLCIICVTAVIKSFMVTNRNKIASGLLLLISIAVLTVFSFGAYLILDKPIYLPRAMYGFGIAISILTIYIADMPQKRFAIPALLLCWCFFTFSFSYGNALADQNRYTDFRVETLARDLANTFPDTEEFQTPKVRIMGSAGFSPIVTNIAKRNNVITRLVPMGEDGAYGYIYLLKNYYHLNLDSDNTLDHTSSVYKTVFDSYYHTIKSDGDSLIIMLKDD